MESRQHLIKQRAGEIIPGEQDADSGEADHGSRQALGPYIATSSAPRCMAVGCAVTYWKEGRGAWVGGLLL